jgi:hypothetical protein
MSDDWKDNLTPAQLYELIHALTLRVRELEEIIAANIPNP